MAHAVSSVAPLELVIWDLCSVKRNFQEAVADCLLGRFLRFRLLLLFDSKRNWGSVNGLFYVSGPAQ